MSDTLALQGIEQSLGDRLLTDHLGQGLGTPLAIEHQRRH